MRLAPMARNRPHHASTLRTSALAVACAALAGLFPGCGDVGSTPAATVRSPRIEGPIDAGRAPFVAGTAFDLAKVGYERMQEMSDPALGLERARATWQKHGRSEKWIQQRMTGQDTRNKLTDYWATHDVKPGDEFAILTNLIHQEWSGVSVAKHKNLKGLKTQNLRDHMSEAELIFTALAELSTRQIAETTTATGLSENKVAAKTGGKIARRARRELETMTGRSVVTGENFLPPSKIKKIK